METIGKWIDRVGRDAARDVWFHADRQAQFTGKAAWPKRVAAARRVFSEFSVANGGGRDPRLFTPQEDSTKGAHNEAFTDEWYEIIHYGAAERTSGVLNMCPCSTKGCRGVCLNKSGHLGMDNGQTAMWVRTNFQYHYPYEFFAVFYAEHFKHEKRAAKMGKRLVSRPNGTTDADWGRLLPLSFFDRFKVSDYTKDYDRTSPHPNYYIVKSAKETAPLPVGENVVVAVKVKRGAPLPKRFEGRRVIDGDVHDLRFLDKQGGYAVLVRAKGIGMQDETGFVRNV